LGAGPLDSRYAGAIGVAIVANVACGMKRFIGQVAALGPGLTLRKMMADAVTMRANRKIIPFLTNLPNIYLVEALPKKSLLTTLVVGLVTRDIGANSLLVSTIQLK